MKYLEQIATESFYALTGSLDLTEHHIKSFPKVTPSKGLICINSKWPPIVHGPVHRFQGLVFPSTNNHTSVQIHRSQLVCYIDAVNRKYNCNIDRLVKYGHLKMAI